MKVLYFLRDDGACGYYRLDLPYRKLAERTDVKVGQLLRGDPLDRIMEHTNADVIIIPRPCEEGSFDWIKCCKELGKKVIIDHDDNVFKVSPFSNHYAEFGVEDVVIGQGGKKITLWRDGVNYNRKENQERLDWFKRCLELSDVVTTTTPILADVFAEYNGNVKVLPNCVDTKLWQKLPLKREDRDEVRLYWSGGSSHFEDLALIEHALPILMNKYKDLKLVLMGMKFDSLLKNVPQDRIEFHKWVPTPAYPYKTAILDADISIIPLQDTEFSRCKSAIKWIEQAALGVPSAASLVSPYKEMYDGTNGVFIASNKTEEWVNAVSTLIEDPMLRWTIGGAAKRSVDQFHSIDSQISKWYTLIKELAHAD